MMPADALELLRPMDAICSALSAIRKYRTTSR